MKVKFIKRGEAIRIVKTGLIWHREDFNYEEGDVLEGITSIELVDYPNLKDCKTSGQTPKAFATLYTPKQNIKSVDWSAVRIIQ